MRGDYPGLSVRGLDPSRAIPTCVGTTGYSGPQTLPSPGHPHMRGDYKDHDSPLLYRFGPSPHAWGLRHPVPRHREGRRAIPTCVGTTPTLGSSIGGAAGHPHMRGDYRGSAKSPDGTVGPSPHAWGLQPHPQSTTPPGAGHPHMRGDYPRFPLLGGWSSGHPHMRGDYEVSTMTTLGPHGPSPHAWGLHGRGVDVPARKRAIPTCVGTTRE